MLADLEDWFYIGCTCWLLLVAATLAVFTVAKRIDTDVEPEDLVFTRSSELRVTGEDGPA